MALQNAFTAGKLIPRGDPGAMILGPDKAAERMLAMVEGEVLITAGGRRIRTLIESICVHCDSLTAVAITRRARLTSAGIEIQSFAP